MSGRDGRRGEGNVGSLEERGTEEWGDGIC